jgi:beta-galactosidase
MPRYLVITCLVAVLIGITVPVTAGPGRTEIELSGSDWLLWLDRNADWREDTVVLPPVDISALPVNPPSCGWDSLTEMRDNIKASVPGTVEEYFWNRHGNSHGTAGDYRGVSWWSRTFTVPADAAGKRITLAFESVNLRAEVFVNNQLVGYDVIGNTPFDVDISSTVRPGRENRLDIRITDPVGTFAWDDENMLRWGPNNVPSVHGFGGITGPIVLRITDAVRIEDIYVQNQQDPKRVKVYVTLSNSGGNAVNGSLALTINSSDDPGNTIVSKDAACTVSSDGLTQEFSIHAPKAKLWDILDPNLYSATATFTSDPDGLSDETSQKFGFRFFTVGEKNGDKRFYLNGKRTFLFAAMTRGFWPKNGIFPTPEMARRDMEIAVDLGFNMMLYHRAIGQPVSMDVADEMGVLTYEEPGGYLCMPKPDETAQVWRREKLRRMVVRDRSRPSLAIINIDDWSFSNPNEWDIANIRMVHELDPSRIVTFNCITTPTVPYDRNNPMKLHMLPYDDELRYVGWLDPYHFTSQPGYIDDYYENPRYFLRGVFDPNSTTMGDSLDVVPHDEIIFYGEEGGLHSAHRLEKIKRELMQTGADGWREQEHLEWYDSYDRYLEKSGMKKSFPTVDDFTTALTGNFHYFHGRNLETIRLMNTADSYVLNGWASAATHTDIVDAYRYPTGDPSIIQWYTQPLYLAVKLRDKVHPAGGTAIADIFIINEKNLKGRHSLDIYLEDPEGTVVYTDTKKVSVLGGEEFGQLLIEGIHLPLLDKPGYYDLRASLKDRSGDEKAVGSDMIFVADYTSGPGIDGTLAVYDTSGVVSEFLSTARGISAPTFDPFGNEPDILIMGAHEFPVARNLGVVKGTRSMWPIMDMVANGTTLIVLENGDSWAKAMSSYDHKSLWYSAPFDWSKRSSMFLGDSRLLDGLPQNCGLGWEYQVLYQDNNSGLRIDPAGMETVIGTVAFHINTFGAAVCRIPYGEGQIILSALPIMRELASQKPQSAVAKKLFMNFIEKGRE